MKRLYYLFILTLFSCNFLFAQTSQNVQLIYHWEDTTLVSSSAHDNTYNEVWGFVQNGKEYGVIGSTEGTHIFDLSDLNNIRQVDFVPGRIRGSQIIHRDYHDYKGYLYMVADEGPSSIQIADLSFLPDSVHLIYDSDSLFQRSHNIFIDTARAKLYSGSTKSLSGFDRLSLYDLTNPRVPTLIDHYNSYGTIHDLYVRNDTAYLNASNSGIRIVDFTDPSSAQLLGDLSSYQGQGYNHSGWLTEDGRHYVFADETHGTEIKILDVSNFGNLNVVSTFHTNVGQNSIPHNLIVKGDYAYVSYYYDGLQIFDISDRNNPVRTGFYRTSTRPLANQRYEGAWGVYVFESGLVLVSDMQEGFFVFNVGQATGLTETESIEFKVYPNPAKEFIQLKFENLEEQATIEIQDLTGKIIQSKIINQNEKQVFMPLNLASGMYLVKFQDQEKTKVQKLIVR